MQWGGIVDHYAHHIQLYVGREGRSYLLIGKDCLRSGNAFQNHHYFYKKWQTPKFPDHWWLKKPTYRPGDRYTVQMIL